MKKVRWCMRRDKNKKRKGDRFGNQNKLSLFKKPDIRFKKVDLPAPEGPTTA